MPNKQMFLNICSNNTILFWPIQGHTLFMEHISFKRWSAFGCVEHHHGIHEQHEITDLASRVITKKRKTNSNTSINGMPKQELVLPVWKGNTKYSYPATKKQTLSEVYAEWFGNQTESSSPGALWCVIRIVTEYMSGTPETKLIALNFVQNNGRRLANEYHFHTYADNNHTSKSHDYLVNRLCKENNWSIEVCSIIQFFICFFHVIREIHKSEFRIAM